MKKIFITIIETEYGEIDDKKMERIKETINRDGAIYTHVEFYELDKVKLIHLED